MLSIFVKEFTSNRVRSIVPAVLTTILLGIYVLVGAYFLLTNYLITDITWYLGLGLVFYIGIVKQGGRYSYGYGILTVVLLVLGYYVPSKTVYYLSLISAVLFALESRIGKLNYLPAILLVVISPVFKHLTTIFGFPIRLQLSQWAGKLVSLLGYQTQVIGNSIVLNGYDFAVDPACVGLQMMTTSFIIGLFLVAYYERKTQKTLSLLNVLLVSGCIIALNILSNLIRITTLVVFKLMPATAFHDLAGILCLLIYVIVPLYFVIRGIYTFTKVPQTLPEARLQPSHLSVFFNIILLAGVTLQGIRLEEQATIKNSKSVDYTLEGFHKKVLPTGILMLEKEEALVYVKPIPGLMSVEHSPLICWQGSGYSFKNVNTAHINGIQIYTGILTKDQGHIYTAWWFDNGKVQTIKQLQWRWELLKGASSFSLINVSAANEQELLRQVSYVLTHLRSKKT